DASGPKDDFEIGTVERPEAGLVHYDVPWIDNDVAMQRSGHGSFVERAVADRWDELAQETDVRSVGPQDMTRVDDQDPRAPTYVAEMVHSLQGQRSVGSQVQEVVLHVDV